MLSIDLHVILILINKLKIWIDYQLKVFFTFLLKDKKDTYISDGLKVSKLTANFNFWVIYPFNQDWLNMGVKIIYDLLMHVLFSD